MMIRSTRLLLILWVAVIRTLASSEDEGDMITEITVTVFESTLSDKESEASSIRSSYEISTHGTTQSASSKVTHSPTTTDYLATSPKEPEQSSSSSSSLSSSSPSSLSSSSSSSSSSSPSSSKTTKQASTSKVLTSEETTSSHVTLTSTTNNTTPVRVSRSSTTQHFTQSPAIATTLPGSSSKLYSPAIVSTRVNPNGTVGTSREATSTLSSSSGGRSTTGRSVFSSPVVKSTSEAPASTVTPYIRGGRFTSKAESTRLTSQAESTSLTSQAESTRDSTEPNNNGVFLIAAVAGGAILLIVCACCLFFARRKTRKRRFWGSGANGSGIAEIGMIFKNNQNKVNGLNLEDTDELDTGFNSTSKDETESKPKIKVQGERDSTVVDRALTTFTPGPENFKRAQDRNLRDMIAKKYDEEDYLGDGDCRDSVAL